MSKKPRFSPTICVTHNCNLDCVYCYQEHDTNVRMNFETAKKCIDWIFNNIPDDMEGVEIGFIGGEPLLEFDLIKKLLNTHVRFRNMEIISFMRQQMGRY